MAAQLQLRIEFSVGVISELPDPVLVLVKTTVGLVIAGSKFGFDGVEMACNTVNRIAELVKLILVGFGVQHGFKRVKPLTHVSLSEVKALLHDVEALIKIFLKFGELIVCHCTKTLWS